MVGGKRTTRQSSETTADDTDRVANLYVQDASGTLLAATDQMEPHAMNAQCLPVPAAPHLILPAQAKIGQTFTAAMTSHCEGALVKFSITATIAGFTTTTVPAGRFRTLVLRRDVTSNATWQGKTMPPSKEVQTMYLARGVGLVKEVTERIGSGAPYEKATDTEVLVSTNRKYDPSGAEDEQ